MSSCNLCFEESKNIICEKCEKVYGPVVDTDRIASGSIETAKIAPGAVVDGFAPVDNNPKTRVGGAHKLPLHLLPVRGLIETCLAFSEGGRKYQPFNWLAEKISASVYYGAMLRHIFRWWMGEDMDASGAHPLAHVAACCLMIMDVEGTDKFNDNRPPYPKGSHKIMDSAADIVEFQRIQADTVFDLHDIAKGDDE